MENKEAAKELKYIRSMIELSSGFRAINGWGVMAVGLVAIAVAWVADIVFGGHLTYRYFQMGPVLVRTSQLLIGGSLVLVLACGLTVFLSSMWFARRRGIPFALDTAMRRLLFAFTVPLLAGGVLCVSLFMQGHYGLTSSVMLIFYGLALINCHHFSHPLLGVLGYLELLLGLVDSFTVTHAFLFWFLGFGVLHVVFGLVLVISDRKRVKRG